MIDISSFSNYGIIVDWLNYHHLHYFWTVARKGSITAACEELGLTPQTISAQIHTLEDSLGEKLFVRRGRGLVLTEFGRLAFHYAEGIFSLGREFLDTFKGRRADRPALLRIGAIGALPKLVVYRLVEPALRIDKPVRLVCRVDNAAELLAALAVDELDVVLTDTPISPTISIRAFHHLLGECGVSFMASTRVAAGYRKKFPFSLDGAPFLLPTGDTALRRSLEHWFSSKDISPQIVGEFADSRLLKVFGHFGNGVFAVPEVIEREVQHQYRVRRVGVADGIVERFYAISMERKVLHPAVAAICSAARSELFA